MFKNQKFVLAKSNFHLINQLTVAVDKKYQIKIGRISFFFSKEQILLLSKYVFDYIQTKKIPFQFPNNQLSIVKLVSCFSELTSLFHLNPMIEISIEKVDIFHYISEIIHNTFLEDCYHLVTSTRSQFFFFTSEHFRANSSLEFINDFKIKAKIKSPELNSK
jgi:hypothetical protein